MEINRGYKPLFKTTIIGLAKVKLPGPVGVSNDESYKAIASAALKEDGDFKSHRMSVYYDTIRFDKSTDGSTFPIIPFASIIRMLVLPNFPDVCFIHFRRSTYGMYVIFRVRKMDYLSQLAKRISIWQESNFSEVEDTESSLPPPRKSPKPPKSENVYSSPPERPTRKRSPQKQAENVKLQRMENPHLRSRRSRSESTPPSTSAPSASSNDECQFVCIKHIHQPEKIYHRKYRSQPPQYSSEESHRYRSNSESRSSDNSSLDVLDYPENAFELRPSNYKIIMPRQRMHSPQRSHRKYDRRIIHVPTNRMQTGRVIVARNSGSSSSTFSSSDVSEFIDMHGREVKTIYPSYMESTRLTPRTLHNERLLHALRKPLHGFE